MVLDVDVEHHDHESISLTQEQNLIHPDLLVPMLLTALEDLR